MRAALDPVPHGRPVLVQTRFKAPQSLTSLRLPELIREMLVRLDEDPNRDGLV